MWRRLSICFNILEPNKKTKPENAVLSFCYNILKTNCVLIYSSLSKLLAEARGDDEIIT